MKFWHLLIILTIILLLILFLSFIYPQEDFKKYTDEISSKRNEIANNYFNDTFPLCHDIPISTSYGLLADSLIVCSATKNIPATPFFYFEKIPSTFYKNGWYFANLDITDFSDIQNSPHNIVCKTKQAYKILTDMLPDKNIIYTGFTSIDRYNPKIQKDYTKFIHVAGKSPWKGTRSLIDTWKLHPEWPQLTLVWRQDSFGTQLDPQEISKIPNIKFMNGFLSDQKLDELVNLCGLHICPSEHEGFGHYINEARSVKAVVLYTDAPCMNEFFTENIGIPIQSHQIEIINTICPVYRSTIQDIEKAVSTAINTDIVTLRKMGERARECYLSDDSKFKTSLSTQISTTKRIPHIVHFIWISHSSPHENSQIPDRYKKFTNSWNYNNQTFTYNFWSGKNILNLISNTFPEFLDFYQNLQTISSKCDFAKLCILYAYGGVCCDLSIVCKKDITPLLQTDSYCIIENVSEGDKSLSTTFIAAAPQNTFIYSSLNYINEQNKKDINIPIELYNHFISTKYPFLVGKNCFSPSTCGNNTALDHFISKKYMIDEQTDYSYKSTPKTRNSKSNSDDDEDEEDTDNPTQDTSITNTDPSKDTQVTDLPNTDIQLGNSNSPSIQTEQNNEQSYS
jgi:glycosyltransferase involved in cell wall biosynthesis